MPLPPPAVSIALFKHHAPNPDPNSGDAVSAVVVAAGTALEGAYQAITEGHAAHMANPLHTRHANLKRSADHSERVVKALGATLGQHANAVEAEIAALDAKVNAPLALPKEPGNHYSVTAQQIREHFAKLPTEDRLRRAMTAAQEGDVVTLGALLNAPGYLSGMDHVGGNTKVNQQQLIAEAYRQHHLAPELERLAKLRKCRELMDTATNIVMRHTSELHPAAELTRAMTLDKAARDATAHAERFV